MRLGVTAIALWWVGGSSSKVKLEDLNEDWDDHDDGEDDGDHDDNGDDDDGETGKMSII